MPSNIIKVNNGGKGFEWNVPDSKMDELLKHLNNNGDPFEEPPCEHQKRMKVIEIPITDGKLNYTEFLDNVQKIINKVNGFEWSELLVCIDCGTVLENNVVGIPDGDFSQNTICKVELGEFACGDIKLAIIASDEYTKLRVNEKYDFFFNRDGSYDGNGIDNPNEEEIQKYKDSPLLKLK